MNSRTIYFDESGFTGSNLLDPAQPIFVVASTDIDETPAERLLRDCFPDYQGPEYKFSRIWGASSGRKGLLKFADALRELHGRYYVWMINKPFGVLTKAVDFLIEPNVTDAGYDFYDEGFCWKYCNYIYFGLTKFAPPELLNGILKNYQSFSRYPSEESLKRLQWQLQIMSRSVDDRVKIFLYQMAQGARLFKRHHDLSEFRGSDDLYTTSMVASITSWRQQHSDDFNVVHDASSYFLKSRDVWERITNSEVPKQTHRLGNGTTVEYPLRVLSTTPTDSRNSRAIQFCDLLAGLSSKILNPYMTGDEKAFCLELLNAGASELTYNGIRPQTIFPDRIPPKQLTGPDIVDDMKNIIFGPHNAHRN